MELIVRVILAVANGSSLRLPYVAVGVAAVSVVGGIVFALMGSSFWFGVAYACFVCAAAYVMLTVLCSIWSELF
jgi:hypothetical protein